MKIYKKLYCRDTASNIRIWWMEQEGNKYRMCSGIENGQIVQSLWTNVEGKNLGRSNETSAEEQASKEIDAKYKKQLKTGYHKNIKDVDKVLYIEPILAKSYQDYENDVNFEKEEWGAQNKYNGICCLASINGLYSRKGEKFISVPHIEKSLQPFFKKYPNAVLHGELFNDEYRQQLNEISKLCRKTVHITEEDFQRSEQLVKYYIYDGYFPDVKLPQETPYKLRKSFIDKEVIGKYKYCELVPTILIKSKQDLDTEFKTRIERGDEGNILRKMDMPYKSGRSKYLLKYKPIDDDEGLIVDIKEGTGNWAGTGKIITLDWEGKIFDATFKGSYEEGVQFLKDKKKWIGKFVTFIYNGLTGLNTPNYARVDINNCIKGDR